jgi:hypothetical protein
MEVEYELTLDDLVAFHEYHCAHSPTIQRQYHRGWWRLPIIVMALWALLGWRSGAFAQFAADEWYWLLLVPVWLITYPWRWHRAQRRAVVNLWNEGENAGSLGRQKLTITPETVMQSNAYREVRTRWEAVEKMERTEHYVFIYFSALHALILPRRAFLTDGEFLRFVGEALHFHEAKRRPATPSL